VRERERRMKKNPTEEKKRREKQVHREEK